MITNEQTSEAKKALLRFHVDCFFYYEFVLRRIAMGISNESLKSIKDIDTFVMKKAMALFIRKRYLIETGEDYSVTDKEARRLKEIYWGLPRYFFEDKVFDFNPYFGYERELEAYYNAAPKGARLRNIFPEFGYFLQIVILTTFQEIIARIQESASWKRHFFIRMLDFHDENWMVIYQTPYCRFFREELMEIYENKSYEAFFEENCLDKTDMRIVKKEEMSQTMDSDLILLKDDSFYEKNIFPTIGSQGQFSVEEKYGTGEYWVHQHQDESDFHFEKPQNLMSRDYFRNFLFNGQMNFKRILIAGK